MALVSWTSIDSRLAALQQECTSLENELSRIQMNYNSLRREHEQKCAEALMQALSSLVKVVKYVNRTDKALIFWVEKKDAVKVALQWIGIDRRTQTIVRQKTVAIKARVSEVETRFNMSSQAFKNSLSVVQSMNTELTQYSLTSIGHAQKEIASFSRELDGKIVQVNRAITQLKVQSQDVEAEASMMPSRISAVNTQWQEAQEASTAAGRVSLRYTMRIELYSPGPAVCDWLFLRRCCIDRRCPLSSGSSDGRWSSGRINWVCCRECCHCCVSYWSNLAETSADTRESGYEVQVNNLQQQERDLTLKLNNLRSQIADLENQIPLLSRRRDDFSKTRQDTSKLEDKCGDLRRESRSIIDELLQARIILSGMVLKTEAIISELSECEYANTRREVAGRLNSLVEGLSDIGIRRNIIYDSRKMKLLSRGMSILQGRTHRVLSIMDSTR